MLFLLLLGGLNVACNVFFIDSYGLQGAAIATLLSLTVYNLVKYLFIRHYMKMTPFGLNTLKVIGIGILVFAILYVMPMPESNIVSIIVRSSLISSLFIGLVYLSKASLDFNNMIVKYGRMIFPK